MNAVNETHECVNSFAPGSRAHAIANLLLQNYSPDKIARLIRGTRPSYVRHVRSLLTRGHPKYRKRPRRQANLRELAELLYFIREGRHP